MLKNRILTALVLIPIIIWGIFSLPYQAFSYTLALLLVVASLEWNNFVAYHRKYSGWLFSFVVSSSFLLVLSLDNRLLLWIIIFVALLWWLLCVPLLFRFPFTPHHLMQRKSIKITLGYIILLSTFVAFHALRSSPQYGPPYVLYLLVIIWLADSGAYFAGRAFGKHKLISNVSPGKTWEGVAGAIGITFIAVFFALNLLHISASQSLTFILISLFTIIYSIIGDLSESMFKRMANIKDSGSMLPGHGGILDRIDSLTSALPVFLLGLWMMEWLK